MITHDGAIGCHVNSMPTAFSIDYEGAQPETITHRQLLELQTDSPTRAGDSGAPVVTRREGGQLVGILIAGPADTEPAGAQGISYAIPTWEVFSLARYGLDEKWTFGVNP